MAHHGCGRRLAFLAWARRLLAAGWLLGGFSVAGLTLADPPRPPPAGEPVRIGVLAYRPVAEAQADWQPLAEYLQRAVPQRRFLVTAYGYDNLEAAIAAGQFDFILTQPAHYVLMAHRNGLSSPLATLVEHDDGHALEAFGGVVFTRAGRTDIEFPDDLRGKILAATGQESLGGYQMQTLELRRAGLRLPGDADMLWVGQPQDRVVEAVLDGRADAGFVRTGLIEALARAGRLDPARLKVLHRQRHPGFPFAVSTRLYPEWPFAAMPGADKDLVRTVAGALLSMEHDSAITRSLGIHGFTTPADYRPVDALLRELRLPPFDALPEFTAEDVLSRWRWQILLAVLGGAAILLLAILLVVVNRKLDAQRRQVRDQEKMLRTIYDVLPVGIALTATDGRMVDCNAATCRLFGLSREEYLDRRVDQDGWRMLRPDGTPMPVDEYACVQAHRVGRPVRGIEMGMVRSDGIVWLSVSAMPAEDPRYGEVIAYVDVTERRIAERALRDEHERNLRYLDTVQTLMVALDAEGRVSMINRYGCELLGWREAELLGRNWFDDCLPQPEGMETIYPVFRRLMENGLATAEYYENPVRCRDGRLRLIAWHNALLREGGRIVGTLSSGEDITERRELERAREREAEERRLLMAALGEGVYGTDRDGRCTFINPAALAMLGLTEAEVVGRDQHDLFHHRRADGSPYPHDECPIHRTLADGMPRHVEEWFFRADGVGFPTDLTVSALERDGERLGAVVVFRDISARKAEEETLRRQREEIDRLSERNARLLESAGEGIFGVDLGFRCTFVNPSALAMLGYGRDELLGREQHRLFHSTRPDGRPAPDTDCPVWQTLQDGRPRNVEDYLVRKSGEYFPVQLAITPIEENGVRVGAEVLFQDISERKAVEARMRLLVSALEASANSILITDPDARIEWVNPAFEKLTGYSRAEAVGRRPAELVKSGRQEHSFYEALWRTIKAGEVWRGELTNRRKDGSLYCQELVIAPVHDEFGRLSHFVGAAQDITVRKNLESEMRALAATDPLTGLPNRRNFLARLEEEAARVQRFEDPPTALLMLDLDHFKRINDGYGHAAGDAMLRAIADCLRDSLRRTDLAGRLGGEEFALLLVGSSADNARLFAERLRERVAALRVEVGARQLGITVSIGVTLLDAADTDADQALARADEALYRAKAAGRDRVEPG